MNQPSRNVRLLYLLALFQLVAGPLMIALVFTFCKTAVSELPEQGLTKAMSKAWRSHDFQALLQDGDAPATPSSKFPLPKPEPVKAKLHLISWTTIPALIPESVDSSTAFAWLEAWTPAWPQAPPSLPPRVG